MAGNGLWGGMSSHAEPKHTAGGCRERDGSCGGNHTDLRMLGLRRRIMDKELIRIILAKEMYVEDCALIPYGRMGENNNLWRRRVRPMGN